MFIATPNHNPKPQRGDMCNMPLIDCKLRYVPTNPMNKLLSRSVYQRFMRGSSELLEVASRGVNGLT